MNIEVSSFFNQGVWKQVDLETFKRMVHPADDDELADMLQALESGQCVLSVFGVWKFRAAPAEQSPSRPPRGKALPVPPGEAGGSGRPVTEA